MHRRARLALTAGLSILIQIAGVAPSFAAAPPSLASGDSVTVVEISHSTALTPPDSEGITFSDVVDSTNFSQEIRWLAERGVSTGWATATGREYRPFQPVTRDAMAAFMYRLAGEPAYALPDQSRFTDVPTNYQFYKEISWLADAGISTGWQTANGAEFRPWDPITRDAMAAFLYRWKQSPAYSPTPVSAFTDVPTSYQFYLQIAWLAAEGISTGYDIGHGCREYRPWGKVTRDAMAAFMFRAVNGGADAVTGGTCSPPPAGPVVANPVTPGAFCKQTEAGWFGYSSSRLLMQCTVSPTDPRLRWRDA